MSAVELGLLATAWLGLARARRPRRPPRRPDTGSSDGSDGERGALKGALVSTSDGTPTPLPILSVRGRLLVVGVVGLLVTGALGPLAGGAVLAVPTIRRWRRRRRARSQGESEVIEQLPEVVDLLVLALGAGLAPTEALAVVGRWATGPVGDVLAESHAEITRGVPVGEALDRARDRCGPQAAGLFAALVAADRYGTPLAPSLERFGHGARLERRRSAEERARRVPVQLLFPLVVCILPAFGLLTVVPLLVNALDGLTS